MQRLWNETGASRPARMKDRACQMHFPERAPSIQSGLPSLLAQLRMSVLVGKVSSTIFLAV
jgi:hypothetical protein